MSFPSFRLVSVLSLGLTLAAGCSSADDTSPGGPPASPAPPASTELPAYDPDPCAHLRGGPAGEHSVAADLGRAHAYARYFGIEPQGHVVDAKLADILDANEPSSPSVVAAYARAVTPASACAADAVPNTLGAAAVVIEHGVAIITPGTGELGAIPSDAKAIALDVRSLGEGEGEGEGARAALERAVAAMVSGDLARLDSEERTCNGQPDEVWTANGTNIDQYGCKAARGAGAVVKGRATSPKPLAVLTAPKLTPLAASAVALLRARKNAIVIGESVPTTLAESRWVGIGNRGLAVRVQRLFAGASPLPDVIEADVRTSDPKGALAAFDWSRERAADRGTAERAAITDGVRAKTWGAQSNRTGDGRASLVVAYAAARTFFPYFAEVGDTIDARLDEVLATIAGDAAKDRAKVLLAIARFGEALHDGHVFPMDHYRAARKAFSPVALLPLGADLVVAASSSPDAKPGDAVVSIDGVPAAKKLEDALRVVSGSVHHARESAALGLVAPDKPIVLRSPDGTTRTVTLAAAAAPVSTFGMFDRRAGTLDDLGAPDVYYVTLNASSTFAPTSADLTAIKAAMSGKRGVVLDMRGYPDRPAWEVLAFVAPDSSNGPFMGDLRVTATTHAVDDEPFQHLSDWGATKQGYTGRVVVLTGAQTQSQAEHWTTFFRSQKRGKVIGGKTSGANGTITGVQLPGGYGFTFTGMVVKHPDGSRFHALGHVPDVEVEPTPMDLRDGKDTVLLRALTLL